MACTEKDGRTAADDYGIVSGKVVCYDGGNAFKVTLADISGFQTSQVAVTESDGSFCFTEVLTGQYTIDVQKEGFVWGWMYVNGIRTSNPIYVDNNQTTNIEVWMQRSPYVNDELTITDISGNPIGDKIVIPRYTSTIAIKLYNGTSQNIYWDLRQNCFVSGQRDTTVGSYTGYTYHTFDIFSDISPTSGNLSPGDITIITGIINNDIYTLDRYGTCLTEMYLYGRSNTHTSNRTIELYFPFM